MALGAVATGSIKAQLALMAAGIIISAGSIPAATPAAASIGINNVAVAVFEVQRYQVWFFFCAPVEVDRPMLSALQIALRRSSYQRVQSQIGLVRLHDSSVGDVNVNRCAGQKLCSLLFVCASLQWACEYQNSATCMSSFLV